MPNLLEKLRQNRKEIYKIAKKYGVSNIRVFGSVARGEETKNSDIDLLVDVSNYNKYCANFSFINFDKELEKIFNRKVDIITEKSLHYLLKNDIIATAKTI